MNFSQILDDHRLDVLYVSKPENVRYLSGFIDGKDGKVLLTRDGPFFVTDGRYIVEASRQPFPHEILLKRNELPKLLSKYFRGKIGFEADHLTVAVLESFRQEMPQVEFVSTSGIIEGFRKIKRQDELENIRRAASLADQGFSHILSFIKPGIREVDVALELEFFCRKLGSEGMAFNTTIASGERSAMPHGGVTTKEIQAGELVTLDFGCTVNGYLSDMTRTVGVGSLGDKLRDIYQTVLEAQVKAQGAVGPGKNGKEIDSLARDHITAKGYGEYFTHGLGHGVGLFIHEGPNFSQISEDVLEPGNVMTVEPGIYIPNVAGCRIEDLVYVNQTGHEVLSKSPKELILL